MTIHGGLHNMKQTPLLGANQPEWVKGPLKLLVKMQLKPLNKTQSTSGCLLLSQKQQTKYLKVLLFIHPNRKHPSRPPTATTPRLRLLDADEAQSGVRSRALEHCFSVSLRGKWWILGYSVQGFETLAHRTSKNMLYDFSLGKSTAIMCHNRFLLQKKQKYREVMFRIQDVPSDMPYKCSCLILQWISFRSSSTKVHKWDTTHPNKLQKSKVPEAPS